MLKVKTCPSRIICLNEKIFLVTILIFITGGRGFWWLKSRPALPTEPPIKDKQKYATNQLRFFKQPKYSQQVHLRRRRVNPPLGFKDAPKEAVTLVLIVDDPMRRLGLGCTGRCGILTRPQHQSWKIPHRLKVLPDKPVPDKMFTAGRARLPVSSLLF